MRCVNLPRSSAMIMRQHAQCFLLGLLGGCRLESSAKLKWLAQVVHALLSSFLVRADNKANEAGLNEAVGAPGSGKGTICHKLSQDYEFCHLSVGDYMRELSRDSTSSDRETIQDYLQQGRLLPTRVILPILHKKIEEEKEKGYRHFLIDGFPRQIAQGVDFEKQVRSSPSQINSAAYHNADWDSYSCYLLSMPSRYGSASLPKSQVTR